MGDFDYSNDRPDLTKQSSKNSFIDKQDRRVNQHGWYQFDPKGHLIDINGHKKFDKSQLTHDNDLPKLLTYEGRRFDVHTVMGQFDKDSQGKIQLKKTTKGWCDL